jgi:hypothetical protein
MRIITVTNEENSVPRTVPICTLEKTESDGILTFPIQLQKLYQKLAHQPLLQ